MGLDCGSVPGKWPAAGALVLASLVAASGAVCAGDTPAGATLPAGADLARLAGSPAYPRPNIVVLMLDDVGAIDDRVWSRLPTIRARFFERGVRATQFHGETPTCTPGRVGFLTGLHTYAHGATRNNGSLFRPAMSIATQLRKSGYFTVLGGKYLNAYGSVEPKVPPGWSEFHAITKGYYDYDLWSNGRRTHHGHKPRDYSTDVVARKLLTSLEHAPKGKPVFVWASPWAAHRPRLPAPRHKHDPRCRGIERWQPPGYMERDVSDKPGYVRRRPLRALEGMRLQPTCTPLLAVDEMLARLTKKLASQGRLANTLFILTSDNGMNYGMHRLLGDKKSPYATQLPFFASWNSRIDPSRPPITERLQNIDLAPTLCDLAGCRLGPYPTGQRRPDGESFAALLLGRGSSLERGSVLGSFLTPGANVPRWSGVETTGHSPLAKQGCALADSGGCRWSYVEYEGGARELYDISNGPCWEWQPGESGDPCRLENLAGRKRSRAIQAVLHKRLVALKRE